MSHFDRIELYCDEPLIVHEVTALTMESAAGELAAERYMELSIPWCHRETYCPGNKVATLSQRQLTPSSHLAHLAERELLRVLLAQ